MSKKIFNLISIISLILFILGFFCLGISIYIIFNDITGFALLFLLGPMFFMGFSLLVSFILSVILIVNYIKEKVKYIKVGKDKTIFTIVNIFQIIILIMVALNVNKIGYIMDEIRMKPVKQRLDELYTNNYEIIDACHYSNAGGTNIIEAIINLKDKDEYSLIHYDIEDKEFYDIYNDIQKSSKLDLDNYFSKEYVSNVFVDEYDFYWISNAEIKIIVGYKEYDLDELATSMKHVIEDYVDMYDSVEIKVYFTDMIDKTKINDYNLFLISQLADDGCDQYFMEQFNNNLIYEDYYWGRYYKGTRDKIDIEILKQELKMKLDNINSGEL